MYTLLVDIVPVHGGATGGKDAPEDIRGVPEVGAAVIPLDEEIAELVLAALSGDRDDRTLRTELVSLKVPTVSVGTVPARLIVGEVVRPMAPLRAMLTAVDILMAGVTEDKELAGDGVAPDDSW